MRAHPRLLEISAWPWLERLSAREGRTITLGSVPDAEWDRMREHGFDAVYLMGVWRRSAIGRAIARSDASLFEGYDRALPGWTPEDVAGSPFSIAGYSPDPRLGTVAELDDTRRRLHARGLQLVLDFVPNHTAFDHPWIALHPERYVTATVEQYRANPAAFRLVHAAGGSSRYVACGRDPHFPPWTDVAQLNYFNQETRRAMLAQLGAIAEHCDGVRCDMAMLVLNHVFARTWGHVTGTPGDSTEFWAEAHREHPGLLTMAEAYWDLEPTLLALGFSYAYDKRFTDRLTHGTASDVREHLGAPPEFQARCVRFLENHDEPRSLAVFGGRLEAAAALHATAPGARFFYDGQIEGRCRFTPVQLARWTDEPPRPEVAELYSRLLEATHAAVFHDGRWQLLEVAGAGDASFAALVAGSWRLGSDLGITVANLGPEPARGHVLVRDVLPGSALHVTLVDRLHATSYTRARADLDRHGLFVQLDPWRAHVFTCP